MAGGGARARDGINDVLIKVLRTGHLRHRRPHLQVGRLGAEDDPGADGRSATSSSARSSRSARTSPTSTPARSSAARGTSSAAAAATAWPAAGTCARTPRASASTGPGAFAEYIVAADDQRLGPRPGIDRDVAAIFDPFGNAVHTALQFDVLGEDVLITGAGPDRRAWPPRSSATPVRATSSSPTSTPTASSWRGRWARRSPSTSARAVDRATCSSELGHEGGLRRRPGDVGQPGGASATCSPTWATAARSPCSASPPSEIAIDWNHGRLQHAHDPRASTAARCTRPGTR